MSLDNLSLKNAKVVLQVGKFRLWSYTNERTNKTSFASTKGLELITIVDYVVWLSHKQVFAWDYPEHFSEKFIKQVNNFGALNLNTSGV